MKSYLMSSLVAQDVRYFSICSTFILSTPDCKNGIQLLPSTNLIFSLISFRVYVSPSSSTEEEKNTNKAVYLTLRERSSQMNEVRPSPFQKWVWTEMSKYKFLQNYQL